MKIVKINHPKGKRPPIQLTVRRCESSVFWSCGFAKEHYLVADMNRSCKCLLFEWNGVPVAFVGILNSPRKGLPYSCSISRIVILPDFQGLGLSTTIFNFVGGIVKSLSDEEHDYRLYIKTAHKKFGDALSRNPSVRGTSFDGKGRDKKAIEHDKHRYRNRLQRVSYCKEYIGDKVDGFQDILRPIGELRKEKMATNKVESMKRGKFIEGIVYEFLKERGYKNLSKTTNEVDMRDHIDFTFYSDKLGKVVGIDVKAPTIIDGYEPNEANYGTFVNNQGIHGWLYGKADFAFIVTFDEFVVVKLSELREFLEKKTEGQEALFGNPKKPYVKFHCSNAGGYRKSISTLFYVEDIKKLPSSYSVKHNKGEEIKQFYKF